jgi:plasmid stabilization system protein ParE
MSRPLVVLDCAQEDLNEAVEWYDGQVPGLGDSLRLSVETTIDAVECFPESYQIDFGSTRRALTHRFPFAVYYRLRAQMVEVVAIFDCRLDPAEIRRRLDTDSRH